MDPSALQPQHRSPFVTGGAPTNSPNQDCTILLNGHCPARRLGFGGSDATSSCKHLKHVAGAVIRVGQYYFINDPKATSYNDFARRGHEDFDYRSNQFSLFFKDDWKVPTI
jgi:hypothetical protein